MIEERWIDAHSVTCAICGGLADERETVSWSEMEEPPIDEQPSTASTETAAALLDRVGSGEAHDVCFEYAKRNGVEPALDELEERDHR